MRCGSVERRLEGGGVHVVSLTIPPLRDRRDDIRALAACFGARHVIERAVVRGSADSIQPVGLHPNYLPRLIRTVDLEAALKKIV